MKTIYFKNPVAGTTESYISYAVQPVNELRNEVSYLNNKRKNRKDSNKNQKSK